MAWSGESLCMGNRQLLTELAQVCSLVRIYQRRFTVRTNTWRKSLPVISYRLKGSWGLEIKVSRIAIWKHCIELLSGELATRKKARGFPHFRFKDLLKMDVSAIKIDIEGCRRCQQRSLKLQTRFTQRVGARIGKLETSIGGEAYLTERKQHGNIGGERVHMHSLKSRLWFS